MTGRRLVRWLVLGSVVVAAACGVPEERHAQPEPAASVPFGLLDRNAPPLLPPVTAAGAETVSLCFVRDDTVVVVETALDPPMELTDVVDALVEPPEDADASLRTAIGEPPLVGDVQVTAGAASVDLLPAITAMSGEEQLLAVAQLVCTLSGRPGVGPVTFTLEGSAVDIPRGDGSLTSGPVSRDDYSNVLG